MTPRARSAVGALGLVAVVLAFVAWSVQSSAFFEWSIDEGMYLMRARMAANGFPLYDAIWFNHPPLLVQLVQLAFDRFGESVAVARLVALAFGALGVVAVGLTARELAGWPAGIAAAVAVAIAPLYCSLARAVMSSLPALAAATMALALALRYGRTGRRRWLVASGLAFGVGLSVKYIGLPLLPAIVLALASPGGAGLRARAIGLAAWAAAAAAVLALVLAPYGTDVVFAQTVGSVLGARDAYPLDVVDNLRDVMEWLSEGHLGIALLGAFGLSLGLVRGGRWFVVAVWLAASVAAVLLQAPLWSHHLLLPLLPLAVGAGHGVVGAVSLLRRAPTASDEGWRPFGVTAGATFLLMLPVVLRMNNDSADFGSSDPLAAIEALSAASTTGYAITDSPMIAFRAGLLVPPNLCDPGAKRFESGDLTLADVAGETIDRFPSPVLTWNGRFVRPGNRAFAQWLAAVGYRPSLVLDAARERVLYAPPAALPAAPPATASAMSATFEGAGFVLAALDAPRRVAAGATVPITLYWRAEGPAIRPYAVSLRLVAPDGTIAAQHDGPPANGIRPMDAWRPDELVIDAYDLAMDAQVPPSALALVVRLYDPETGNVLPVADPGRGSAIEGGAALSIGTVRWQPTPTVP